MDTAKEEIDPWHFIIQTCSPGGNSDLLYVITIYQHDNRVVLLLYKPNTDYSNGETTRASLLNLDGFIHLTFAVQKWFIISFSSIIDLRLIHVSQLNPEILHIGYGINAHMRMKAFRSKILNERNTLSSNFLYSNYFLHNKTLIL